MQTLPLSLPALIRLLCQPALLVAVLVSLVFFPVLRAAEAGVITGSVNNVGTRNSLESAKVEIPALGLVALTDITGRYVLSGVPAGTHEIVASYLGLDAARSSVVVVAGQRVVRDFDLTSGIYKLSEFKVTGIREGNAAAITAQRNADNVKNVVSMDSFGNLPNMSAGELAIRLPGVAGALDDEGNVSGLIVRGMSANLNRVTVDGGLIANVAGMSRAFQSHSLTGAIFDQMEVIKGHTPDKGADSLGGTINLKTRSPLAMTEKRRVTYSAAARWAPPFTQQHPLREARPSHPLINVAYQEIFNVFGGERNLGVALGAFYTENVAGWYMTYRDFEFTTNQPAYLWDYNTIDAENNRKQGAMNLKMDYRYSPNTKFTFNTVYNDATEPGYRYYTVRAFTNQIAPNATTSGVVPGYTNLITTVRPVATSVIDVTSTMFGNFVRTRQFDFGGEHTYDKLEIDYNATYSHVHMNLGSNEGGALTNRISGIGWVFDRTQSDLYPRFTQTDGPDITNAANYRPFGQLTTRRNDRDTEVRNVRAHARYKLPTSFVLSAKTGFDWREQMVREVSRQRAWNYVGNTALPADRSIPRWGKEKTRLNAPAFSSAEFIKDDNIVNPSLWNEDRYYSESTNYTGTRAVTESVMAGYGMLQAKIGHTGLLSGVRVEKTDTESWGWVRARTGSTTAQRTADPIGSAKSDYANTRRELEGSYTNAFPSAHLTHDITPSLKARLSWSTSFGRPGMNNSLPNESINEPGQTLTINNPSLKPQTATNWDATLDYYFEPVGNFSVGWFHKDLKDYLVTGQSTGTIASGASNGYNGEYAGFTTLTTLNAGSAVVQGWEISYQQQFTFLPGLLKGLALSVNYTVLQTHGDFGGTTYLGTGQIPGFIPKTGNVNLTWRHRGFGARVLVNYNGEYISTYNQTSPGRNRYRYKRTIVDLGASYQFTPKIGVTLDVSNLFNEHLAWYQGIPSQMQRTHILGTTVNLGLTGRF